MFWLRPAALFECTACTFFTITLIIIIIIIIAWSSSVAGMQDKVCAFIARCSGSGETTTDRRLWIVECWHPCRSSYVLLVQIIIIVSSAWVSSVNVAWRFINNRSADGIRRAGACVRQCWLCTQRFGLYVVSTEHCVLVARVCRALCDAWNAPRFAPSPMRKENRHTSTVA